MNRLSNSSNSEYFNDLDEYKRCYGRYCNNDGKNPLRIVYINKVGWFCDSCKQGLIDLKLVEEVNKD